MTYVELIVVLSIFATISSVILFNYGAFQDKVDIKILASDIASKIVEAQHASLSGLLPGNQTSGWKPAYGVYFDLSNSGSDKDFIYFVDLNSDSQYSDGFSSCTNECLNKVTITKGNYVKKIENCSNEDCSSSDTINSLAVSFSRPSSIAALFFGTTKLVVPFYVKITISSPRDLLGSVRIYPSGRVQVN